MDVRALFVAAFAVVALSGLAMAAEAQLETFLKPEEVTTGFDERSAVQGNLVAVTGLLVAAAMTVIGAVMAQVPVRQRMLPLATIFLSSYILVLFIQTAMFNYIVIDISRAASFSVSAVLYNGVAAPSVYIGPLAIFAGASIGLLAASRRLLGRVDVLEEPRTALKAYVGAVSLAAPFLICLVWGNLQVLMALPEQDVGTLPYLLVLPLAGLAGLALLIIASLKIWHLGHTVRRGAAGLAAHDAWIALRRAEWAAGGALVAASAIAAVLEPVPLGILEAGPVFGLTARSHTQASVFALLPLIPALSMQLPVLRILRAERTLAGRAEHRSILFVALTLGLLGLGFGLAGLATAVISGVLWAWVLAALPITVFGLVALRPQDGLLPAMMAATLLWSIGNTVTGSFELVSNSTVDYDTRPGMLALWRAAAVLVISWAVARAARGALGSTARTWAWPVTAGIGGAVGLLVFLQLPFSAWIIYEHGSEYVGIGTVVSSQDPPVRFVIHALSGAAAFLTGLGVARLHRPDWFTRRASPLPALRPAPDGQA